MPERPIDSAKTLSANASPSIRSLLGQHYLFIFVLLTAVTLLYTSNQPAIAQMAVTSGTTPNGTIPPGGTLPPPIPDTTQGQVRVLHLAPIAADLNNTEVDICTANGSPVAGLSGLVYLENNDYVIFPPATYDWFVGTPGCATVLLDLSPFLLAPGTAATLLIVGGANGQPLNSIFIIDALGSANQLYLPLVRL